jgi:hypothetical protein
MSPAILQLVIFGIEEAVTQAPGLIAELQQIFANGAPTAADFAALRVKVASESYGQFVPGSSIPPTA